MNLICFHNPNEKNGYLSNWYPSKFTVRGVQFSSMEQFMMYQKAVSFGDGDTARFSKSTMSLLLKNWDDKSQTTMTVIGMVSAKSQCLKDCSLSLRKMKT